MCVFESKSNNDYNVEMNGKNFKATFTSILENLKQ